MIDKEHLEQSGLHALDLLEDGERLLYERELRVNPHLRGALRDVSDQLAAVSLTIPQATPPARLWAGIEKQLSRKSSRSLSPRWHSSLCRNLFQPAWAAAALALLSTGLGIRHYQMADRLAVLEAQQASRDGGRKNQSGNSHDGGQATLPPWQDPDGPFHSTDKVASGTTRPSSGSRMMRPVTLPLSVQRELDQRRAGGPSQPRQSNASSELRLMEMHPPGTTAPGLRERGPLIGRFSDAIAAAATAKPAQDPEEPAPVAGTPSDSPPAPATAPAEATTPPAAPPAAPPEPILLHGEGSSPSSDFIIQQGGTVNLGSLNLHPDAQVVHQNFPPDSEFDRWGLSRIDEDRVWDGHGGIWHRQADGHSYVGQQAPVGFQPPDPDDPGTVSESPLRPAPPKPLPEPDSGNTVAEPPTPPGGTPSPATTPTQEAATPTPYALPIIASDGQGVIVTQHLPEPAAGYRYAFWSHDPAGGAPVLLGVLPADGSVNGVFAFELPKGLPLPTGYLITRQLQTDFSKPGPSVLQGP